MNLIPVLLFTFFPSMDGPAHLYNAGIIHKLLQGNAFLEDYYILNNIPIPNWLSHAVLLTSMHLFSGSVAEKILLLIYLIGLPLSFRFFLKKAGNNPLSSYLIFPFTYNFLFLLGFYNFNLSFIFLFFALYKFWNSEFNFNFKNFFWLFSLLTLTYFSNILTFGILCLMLAILFLTNSYLNKSMTYTYWELVKKLSLLLLAGLPSLIFLYFFNSEINFPSSTEKYQKVILWKWINDLRPLIIYDYNKELIYTEQIFHLILVILALILFFRFQAFSQKSGLETEKKFYFFNKTDILGVLGAIFLILLFIIPNGAGAGMMSDRLCILFFILLVSWIGLQPLPKNLFIVVLPLLLFIHFKLLLNHTGTLKSLDADAKELNLAGKEVKAPAVVLPVNVSDNWLELHFSNYIGIDPPLVILENYEAYLGWFPIKWNLDKMPQLLLGDKATVAGTSWLSGSRKDAYKKIDYVVVYGNMAKFQADPVYEELRTTITKHYELSHKSESNYVHLYRLR